MNKPLEVVWTTRAENSYLKIINYILENWSQKEAAILHESTNSLIENLQKFKNICPESSLTPNIRRCIISKQTSMTYRVKGHKLIILLFYHNKGSHKH